MYFLLRNRQHERFISGVTPVPTTMARNPTVTLSKNTSLIGKDFVDDFKGKDHVVVATIVDVANRDRRMKGTVVGDALTLAVNGVGAGPVNVAWIVDTEGTSAGLVTAGQA